MGFQGNSRLMVFFFFFFWIFGLMGFKDLTFRLMGLSEFVFWWRILSKKNSWVCFLDVQREEKSVQKSIREAAKRNDMGSAKVIYQFLLLFHDIWYGSLFMYFKNN